MGKHSVAKMARGLAGLPGAKAMVTATAAGTLFGIGSTTAMAAPKAADADKLSAPAAVVPASVDLSQGVSADVTAAAANTQNSSGWVFTVPAAEVKPKPEIKEGIAAAGQGAIDWSGIDIAPGSNASVLVQAALAQVGRHQDCTALVENSLRAAGFSVGNLGTGIWQYDRFGSRVSLDALAPGDILVYGNAGSGAHVSVYLGDGQAVHGGWNGTTAVAGMNISRIPITGAIRLP